MQAFNIRVLETPRQTRNTLLYVLNNALHHGDAWRERTITDPYSSGAHFDGWELPVDGAPPPPHDQVVAAAESWLLTAYLPSPLGDASYLHYFADRAEGISNSVFELGSSWAGVPQDFAYPLCWFVACIALSAILLARRAVP